MTGPTVPEGRATELLTLVRDTQRRGNILQTMLESVWQAAAKAVTQAHQLRHARRGRS